MIRAREIYDSRGNPTVEVWQGSGVWIRGVGLRLHSVGPAGT